MHRCARDGALCGLQRVCGLYTGGCGTSFVHGLWLVHERVLCVRCCLSKFMRRGRARA